MSGWRDKANCRKSPPELFFPLAYGGEQEQAAKRVCAGCIVREDCLEFAHRYLGFGIAGGLNGDERASIRDKQHDRVGVR